MATATKQRRKRCSECNELKPADEVLGSQKLCEECEGRMSYCAVCKEFADRAWGDTCRHVQWHDGGGFECGCGSQDIEADKHKASFMVLLAHLAPLEISDWGESPRPLLPTLREKIAANNFWTCWHGPIIGGPPDLEFRHELRNDCCLGFYNLRARTQCEWTGEAIDEMQLGMSWLTSLDTETKEANALTVKWIDEFLSEPPTAAPRQE